MLKQLGAGLGLRGQASFGRSFLTAAPYIDLSSDLLARAWYHDQENSLQTAAGETYQRLATGINFYIDFPGLSIGLGMEWGQRLHPRENNSSYQSLQLMLRSP
ncbi:MAG: hypothetical protein ACOH5I_10475 [Oligoflexus sp.]